jgi:hypothetical protein
MQDQTSKRSECDTKDQPVGTDERALTRETDRPIVSTRLHGGVDTFGSFV